MTEQAIIDRLTINARNGRGFWIGLCADRNAKHELTKLEIEKINDNLQLVNDETHITLAHMGRQNDQRVVESALIAAEMTASSFDCSSVSVEGVARFMNHLVMIVAPKMIDAVGKHLDAGLSDRHVFPDRTFAGVRHVTIGSLKRGVIDTSFKICRTDRYDLVFTKMIVVCGDERVEFKLQATPPDPF